MVAEDAREVIARAIDPGAFATNPDQYVPRLERLQIAEARQVADRVLAALAAADRGRAVAAAEDARDVLAQIVVHWMERPIEDRWVNPRSFADLVLGALDAAGLTVVPRENKDG